MPSLFSLCLSLPLSPLCPLFLNCTSHYPPFSIVRCFLLSTSYCHPFVLSHHLPLLLDTSACILYPLPPSSFLLLLSLSAAMLWRCSDLQPSLDRVRSASTTCLRPDSNFHSPDRDRYKKKILIAVCESRDFLLKTNTETMIIDCSSDICQIRFSWLHDWIIHHFGFLMLHVFTPVHVSHVCVLFIHEFIITYLLTGWILNLWHIFNLSMRRRWRWQKP